MQLWSLLLWSCEDGQKVGDTLGLAQGCSGGLKFGALGFCLWPWLERGWGGGRKTPGARHGSAIEPAPAPGLLRVELPGVAVDPAPVGLQLEAAGIAAFP